MLQNKFEQLQFSIVTWCKRKKHITFFNCKVQCFFELYIPPLQSYYKLQYWSDGNVINNLNFSQWNIHKLRFFMCFLLRLKVSKKNRDVIFLRQKSPMNKIEIIYTEKESFWKFQIDESERINKLKVKFYMCAVYSSGVWFCSFFSSFFDLFWYRIFFLLDFRQHFVSNISRWNSTEYTGILIHWVSIHSENHRKKK